MGNIEKFAQACMEKLIQVKLNLYEDLYANSPNI
jgi:hypothetical protein